jgi:hypothetical protein
MTIQPKWLSAFLDFSAASFNGGSQFWSAVTGFELSPPRGNTGEFVSLLPADGDDYLRIQRTEDAASRIHLDLSVTDSRAAADEASGLGATELADAGDYVVLRSPGGLIFCLVEHSGWRRPTAAVWPGGHRSGVYQVCLDVPQESYAVELAFWERVMNATAEVLQSRPEFSWLRGKQQLALDVLVQRLESPWGDVRAHLDLGTNVRAAEVARHRELGAEELVTEEFWTVMRDPTGLTYCITDRDPATGRLVAAQNAPT